MTVNVQNVTKLINHLRKINEANFDMSEWFDRNYYLDEEGYLWDVKPAAELVTYMEKGKGNCGTVACIAGHAALLEAAEKGKLTENITCVQSKAEEWLGLPHEMAQSLFKPGIWDNNEYAGGDLRKHSLDKTLEVLEH